MRTESNERNEHSGRGAGSSDPYAPMPKHIPFPDCAHNSELLSELIMFLFMSCTAAMQFINIYRTMWWLPGYYINNAVNFYKIDSDVIMLVALMAGRRLSYLLLLRLLELLLQRRKQQGLYRQLLKYSFAISLLSLLLYCIIRLYQKNTYITLFLLVYPFIVYLLIFGFKIEPFLRSSSELNGVYFNGMPMHCCSTNPAAIRDEIETLKNDFNNRFKQVIFTSVVNAYYAGFVPCFFAVSIYYNVLWVMQHIIFIWCSSFMMCTVFLLPSKYSDILHRSALHLGRWWKVDLRDSSAANNENAGGNSGRGILSPNIVAFHNASSAWNKTMLWPNGSVVKHSGELFCCIGSVTVALPGNSSHSRFYNLFRNPTIIYRVLTIVQLVIVIVQLLLLYFVVEWHFVLSISFITLTNQFTFFKVVRDYFLTNRVYTAEAATSETHLQ